uniref:Putative secreted protein n=1 Tax=Anopheles darlingi TaxID=43151 RepID=A0A2M4D2M6_ANODA
MIFTLDLSHFITPLSSWTLVIVVAVQSVPRARPSFPSCYLLPVHQPAGRRRVHGTAISGKFRSRSRFFLPPFLQNGTSSRYLVGWSLNFCTVLLKNR